MVTQKFLATIYKIWMLRYVDVPEEISSALAKQAVAGAKRKTRKKPAAKPKYIPVVATVNNGSARTTLVPAGGGRYRMQFNATLRKAAHGDIGDTVSVAIQIDRESRELAVPPDLRAMLKAHPKARKAFDNLATGHRRQFIKWFDSAKSQEARLRRTTRALDILLERALLRAQPRKLKRVSN